MTHNMDYLDLPAGKKENTKKDDGTGPEGNSSSPQTGTTLTTHTREISGTVARSSETAGTNGGGSKRSSVSLRWKTMKPEQKKEAVIKAVLRVIAKHGVQGTTTARIAAALGVSEPTIYRVFPSRREMLLAAAQSLWRQRREELEAFVPVDAMDYLRKLSAHHTAGIQKTRVTRYLYELSVARPSDGLRDYLRGEMIAEAERLAAIVEQGQKEGCIRADVDPGETAWRIMTVYWLEAMARLHGLEDILLTGFSTRFFDGILTDIAAAPLDAPGEQQTVGQSSVKASGLEGV
ncbi:MAG: TetR/AcrR family transcriptional regulator [Thermoleophilia bacterium]|nr:TetR/AcrR family transcriptional regulator [Thermoleophilia bacterium]